MTLTDTAKGLILDLIGVALDVDGGNNGYLAYQTSGNVEVARTEFNDDAFAAATGSGTVSIAMTTTSAVEDADVDGSANPITHAHLCQGDGTDLASLTVGTSASDIILTSTTLAAHEALELTTGSIYMS
jgi:hypothetical protein